MDVVLSQMPGAGATPADSWVVFSGTIATKAELIFGGRSDFEMVDTVRNVNSDTDIIFEYYRNIFQLTLFCGRLMSCARFKDRPYAQARNPNHPSEDEAIGLALLKKY